MKMRGKRRRRGRKNDGDILFRLFDAEGHGLDEKKNNCIVNKKREGFNIRKVNRLSMKKGGGASKSNI